jgi:hypothetical protein
MADPTTPDDDAAQDVYRAARALQAAVDAAHGRRMRVDVSVHDHHTVGSQHARPILIVNVLRPVEERGR